MIKQGMRVTKCKITVVGAGYVGLSNALLLAQHNDVVLFDIDIKKIQMIRSGISPIDDREVEKFLSIFINGGDEREKYNGSFSVTTDKQEAYSSAEYIVVATPTDYDYHTDYFDTSSVESVIADILKINDQAHIVIKSTVPVGFTKEIQSKTAKKGIIFSPEFLREGYALHDNLYPSRIIVGDKSEIGNRFATLLLQGAWSEKSPPVLLTESTEAEAVKLFSNTYLAMRIAFFNELDSFAEMNALDTMQIIEGVGLDPRIGLHYNNPSFGYGGYCLPKDTKQLLANYRNVPSKMIQAIVEANDTRKTFIARQIMQRSGKAENSTVGIYRLVMKQGSDNFRNSSTLSIIQMLKEEDIPMVIYEPSIRDDVFMGVSVIHDLHQFKDISGLIVANRVDEQIEDVQEKIYTRDIFGGDR